jgi:signal transduction histidine kinase
MMTAFSSMAPVHGLVDSEGRLVEADAALADLHRRAGGLPGGTIAVPQLATLARLARRLGIVVSRNVIAADGDTDLDLWVRAQPEGGRVRLAIAGWTARPAPAPSDADRVVREHDFLRAGADWLWESDETLRITALSAFARETAGDVEGQPITRLFTLLEAADGSLPIVDALARQQRFDNQMVTLRSAADIRMRLSAAPTFDGDGRFTGFRGSAQMQPVLPPPDQESDAFGRRLDTALREPLDRIIGNAESIRAQVEGPLRADYVDYAGDIASAGRHLLALVDDLVDLQAIERPGFTVEAEAIDLADVARRAAALLSVRAADRQVVIVRPQPGEALPAIGDTRRALQILVNLIGNAVRYSPEGGQVWVRAEREGDWATLLVADQGRGIAPEHQARIFGKFERVDPNEPGGTGLGLYIAQRLAQAMGGTITLDSAPGQGARFTLTLRAG